MFSDNDSESYDFELPKELKPWLEFQLSQHPQLHNFHYILENGRIKEADWASYLAFCSRDSRTSRVDFIQINDDIEVSTVFLSINHNFSFEGPPILFETMVFGGSPNQYQRRYSTLGDAKKGHWETVDLVRKSLNKP